MSTLRYAREPSAAFVAMLRQGGMLAPLLACLGVACHERESSCLEERWAIVVEDDRLSEPCAVEIADDGTAVVLTGGPSASIVEVSADGQEVRNVSLPPSGPDVDQVRCADLAIGADGTRWAIVVQYHSNDARDAAVYSVTPGGDAEHRELVGPAGFAWMPTRVAVDGDSIYLAGTARATGEVDIQAGRAFVARVLDRMTLDVVAELSDMLNVHELAVAGPERLYVVATPPSIDYADAHLFAIEPQGGATSWRAVVGVDRSSSSEPDFDAAIGIGAADVLVATFVKSTATVERLRSDGRVLWRADAEHAVPVGSVEVVTNGDRVVAVVSSTGARPDLGMPAPEARVFDLEGEERCGMTLASSEAPVIEALGAHSRSGAIAVAGERESGAGAWIAGLDVLR
jgi:hypothetical protein